MVNIEIDGKKLTVEPGSMVIEAADEAGIYIPRFCYHKKLSVAANCRMCLVDVAKAPKALPACATPVNEGMIIQTKSKKALDAQKAVMEFLLINHPLDCPICDQGGECELQDIAMGYGGDISQYVEGKRVVADKDIGPLIATEMTRCIHCTRCVRFGTEVAGMREMGATGRGEHMTIGTFIEKSVDSEVSGNVIDLCPVGALTAKPSRFTARAWELQSRPSIAPHDCLGSNIDVHFRRNEIMRVVPRENESINEVWLSDRDRFAYEGLLKSERLIAPRVKRDGVWRDVTWQEALELTAANLRRAGAGVAALASASSTTEELYLLQKVVRGLGSNNVDFRLRQSDFSAEQEAGLSPQLNISIADLENLDATLLVGSNLRQEQPLAAVRLRKATRDGVVMSIATTAYDWTFRVVQDIVNSDVLAQLAGVAKALVEKNAGTGAEFASVVASATVTDAHRAIAEQLMKAEKKAIIIGVVAQEHSEASNIQRLANIIGKLSGTPVGVLTSGANTAGAWLAGAVPHRREAGHVVDKAGLNAHAMLSAPQKAYVLMGVEPEHDSIHGMRSLDAIKGAEFVVALTPFADGKVSEYADVMLPIAAFVETSGSYVNAAGVFQSFAAVVPAKGEARPGWKVLRVLGNLLNLKGFDYVSSEDVLAELQAALKTPGAGDAKWSTPTKVSGGVSAVAQNMYTIDALVRRAPSLQRTVQACEVTVQAARVKGA